MIRWTHRRPRRPGTGGALLPAVVVVGLLLGVSPPAGSAQATQGVVAERQLEFQSARSAHESALDARSAAERRFSRALQEIEGARASQDDDRIEAAYARAQQQAVELQSLEQRVRQTAQRTEEAREALLQALDQRLESLVAELSRTAGRQEQQELAALIRNLRNRVQEVERAGELTREIQLVAVPEVTFDPRDGPVELQWKAELLERRAEQYEERIGEIDAQIEQLRRRQRRNRNLQDMLAGIERFDDDQVPVTPRQERRDSDAEAVEPEGGQPSDSAGAEAPQMTLEERVQSLEVLRLRIESFREQVLVRASQFRERAQEIS